MSNQADRPEPGDFPSDPLLQSGSFIYSAPGNGGTLGNGIKRRSSQPLNGASDPTEGAGMSNGADHAKPAETLESTASPTETKARRRGFPEGWLPPGWIVEEKVRTSGTKSGRVDKYYLDPTSGCKFRSRNEVMYYLEHGTPNKKNKGTENSDGHSDPSESQGRDKSSRTTKKGTCLNFDYLNAPEKINWVLTNTSEESWTPFIGDDKVPESQSQEWTAAFSVFTTKNGGRMIL